LRRAPADCRGADPPGRVARIIVDDTFHLKDRDVAFELVEISFCAPVAARKRSLNSATE
jgi:hypothetical protein